MSERITQELRRKMDTLGWYDEDGNIVFTTGGTPAGEMACLVLNSKAFANLCDAIDSVHANLERENDRLKCELDRVLGELDGMHKTEGISNKPTTFMHSGMSITHELREYTEKQIKWLDMTKVHYRNLFAIADRIDAEVADMQAFCDRLRKAAEGREDVTLWCVDYVALPVDADGEPIHVGDVVEWADGSTCEVVGIGDGGTLYYMDEIEGTIGWTNADGKRHHHADTWESIIEDALDGHHDTDFDALVARCKALAGGSE